MRGVAIIGVGMTKFGQLWDRSLTSLAVEAGAKAVHDAGIRHKDVEVLYGGTMSSGLFANQEHLASMFADHSGFKHIPSVRIEAACASGGLALRQAYLDIGSGANDIAVVGGVEKMTDLGTYPVTKVLSTASDTERESAMGVTFPGIYAMMARLHMHKYGTKEEQMALMSLGSIEDAATAFLEASTAIVAVSSSSPGTAFWCTMSADAILEGSLPQTGAISSTFIL